MPHPTTCFISPLSHCPTSILWIQRLSGGIRAAGKVFSVCRFYRCIFCYSGSAGVFIFMFLSQLYKKMMKWWHTYSVVTEKLFSCLRIWAGCKSRILFGFFMPMNVASTQKPPPLSDLVFVLFCFSHNGIQYHIKTDTEKKWILSIPCHF